MALIHSKQLNPKLTGSFILSGSTQTFVGSSDFQGSVSSSGTITLPQIINFEGGNGGTKYTFNNISDVQNGATGRNLGFTIATGSNVGGAVVNISGSGGNAFVGIGTAYTDAMYHALTVKGNISASGDVDIDGNITSSGTITGSALYGTTIGQNRTDGVKTITIEANSIINQDLSTDADATLGTLSVGNVTSTGTITGSAVYGTTIGQNRVDGVKTLTIESNSTVNQDLTTDANVQFNHITASGNISSSGTIYADNFQSTGGDSEGISFTDDLNLSGNLTASGDISGSATSTGSFGHIITTGEISSSGRVHVNNSFPQLKLSDDGYTDHAKIGLNGDSIYLQGSDTSIGVRLRRSDNFDIARFIMSEERTEISGSGGLYVKTHVTASGTITGSEVYGTTIGQNRTDGVKTITIEANSAINQDLTTDANPTFAGVNLNGDSNITGSLTVTGDLTAQQYIVSSSVTYMTQSFASGSNIFGDDVQDTHQFTGSVNVSGSITATSPETGSTTIIATNMQNGYPTSNFWGENLEGSYFNNFDNTTHVSEILRFMSGVLSSSLDVADASPNEKTWASLTTSENNKGGTDSVDGYLPQSYDSSNATMKYLVTKNWISEGAPAFNSISVYHDNGPTYYVDFDSVVNDANLVTVSSSADAQLFGLGGLTSGTATQFDARICATQSFSDTGSITTPTTASNTFTTQSQFDVSMTSFGTSNGVSLAKINTAQPAVIPAAYQDGKFVNFGGQNMSGSLTRRFSGSLHDAFNDFTSVSASGYYSIQSKVGIATGSGNYSYKNGTTQTHFFAPVDQIETDIGSNTLGITNVTQSYLSATSRSLSGAPYLVGATYHLSASVHGLFDPLYAASSTLVDDSIGSVGVGSVGGSGVDGLSTSGGTIQTSNAVFTNSGSSPTLRGTSVVPTRTDIYKHNATYTLSGTTGENVNQSGVSDSTFTVGVRARNRASSQSTLATYTYFYHTGSSFGQPADSGSMAVYQRTQGYDGGSLTGTSEAFTGEDFRIVLDNNVVGFNGTGWTTTFALNQLGNYDLQVKPGFLVDPGGTYGYWYPTNHGTGTYKYYIRRFRTSGTKTSMTLDIGKTLVNWNASTNNSAAVGLIFKSAASGSGANSVQSVCRIYDPSALTDNLIESNVSADNFKNPFTSDINLYGNTGGSKSSTEYTIPIRNADGMYLDDSDNEVYVIVRYRGTFTPVTSISLGFS